MEQPLLIEHDRDARVTVFTLNRPTRRNAFTLPLLRQIPSAVREAETSARVLIITGAPPVFCAGLDLAETADHPHEAAEAVRDMLLAVARCSLPTIAAVAGAAVAGGAGLAAVCDFTVVEESARIGFPEVRRGLAPALVTVFLRGRLRENELRELLLSGELISAERAVDIGLASRIAKDGASLPTARALAGELIKGGPEAIARTKQLLAEMRPSSWEDDCAVALQFHNEARNSDEAREGAAAFLEKRPPSWFA